jgi:hypothetical protein
MFDLPPIMYLVLTEYPDLGLGSPDVKTTLNDAADQAAEAMEKYGAAIRVLRFTDAMNVDDVTADALAALERRVMVAA